jgi:hypothetical protein
MNLSAVFFEALMTREFDRVELGHRVAGSLQIENQRITDQRQAWIDYLAMTASTGGGTRG